VTGRILLVEPDVVLGAILKEVLGHSGYEVIIVSTLKGEGGNIHSASAVILDIDTTSAEKERAWLEALQSYDESLSIILLGLQVPQEPTHRLCLDLGRRQTNVLTVVRKPFRSEELLDALRQVQESSLPGQTTEI